jgi:hypothetical protein
MNYTDTSTAEGYRLFAAAGDTIYDATPATAVPVFTGLSNDKFQHTNLTNAAGHFLVACNGEDPVLIFDGSVGYYISHN